MLSWCQPGWVGPLGEQDVLPTAAPAEEGSLLAADKGAALIRPCFPTPAADAAAAVHLPPACDETRLHTGFRQRGRCLQGQCDSPQGTFWKIGALSPDQMSAGSSRTEPRACPHAKSSQASIPLTRKAIPAGVLWRPAQVSRTNCLRQAGDHHMQGLPSDKASSAFPCCRHAKALCLPGLCSSCPELGSLRVR